MFREVITRACPLPPLLLLTRDRNTRASSLRGGREREREREREKEREKERSRSDNGNAGTSNATMIESRPPPPREI